MKYTEKQTKKDRKESTRKRKKRKGEKIPNKNTYIHTPTIEMNAEIKHFYL